MVIWFGFPPWNDGSGNDGHLAGNFRNADICGHFRMPGFSGCGSTPRTQGSHKGCPYGITRLCVLVVDMLDASDGRLKGHGAGSGETVCCTGNMVGRCFTTWQVAGVSLSEL